MPLGGEAGVLLFGVPSRAEVVEVALGTALQGATCERVTLGEEGRGEADEMDDDAPAPAPAATLALGVFWDCSKAQEEILSTVVRP